MVNCVTIDKGDRVPVSPNWQVLGFTQPTGDGCPRFSESFSTESPTIAHPRANMVNCVTIDKGDRVPVSPNWQVLGFTQPTGDGCPRFSESFSTASPTIAHPRANMVNCVTIDKGDRVPVSPNWQVLGFTQPTGDGCPRFSESFSTESPTIAHPRANMVNCVTIDKGDRVPVSPNWQVLGFTQPTGDGCPRFSESFSTESPTIAHPRANMVNCVTIDKGDRVPVSPNWQVLGFTQPTGDGCPRFSESFSTESPTIAHPRANMVNCVTIDKGDRLTVGFRALGFTQPTV
ncbi:hypothetical protein [Limnospira platensis]|uniref:hypothetical protein n=2 Tax=Limnospira platensis TaxID=118562 RepID=UPI00396CA83E